MCLIQRHFGPCEDTDPSLRGGGHPHRHLGGWSHPATVIDLDSRKVMGWARADHMRTEFLEDALSAAFASRAPAMGVIFHSDSDASTRARTSPTSPVGADLARRSRPRP